jgi:two-component system, LytTR family, response regulator
VIKVIILDDEQPSVDKLDKLLTESGMVEIKGKFIEPLAALDFLQNNKIDAAFLDIEMPDLDGIEFSNRLIDLQERVAVVFVTAYNQYAVEAFRLNALDFLMKPVTAERLRASLDRIVEEKEIRMHPAEVQIRCFGKFSVTTANGEVKFRTEKAEELLALLIDRKGNFVARNEIIDDLWEEYDADRALIHFNTTLHYIKKALLQQGVAIPIEHQRGSYRFDLSRLACDYCRFQALAARTESVNPINISEYEEVAGLYSGDYLAGKEFAWAERNRQLLKDQFIHLLLEIAGYHKTAGNHQIAVKWLKQGLIHEPLHREINYRLIEALLFSNNRISADRYFDIYKNALRRKLGQGPDDGFKKLLG